MELNGPQQLFKYDICRPEKGERREEEEEGGSPLAPGSLKSSLVTITATLTTLGLFFALGALLFTAWEDWTFFDAFYFCKMEFIMKTLHVYTVLEVKSI